MSAVRREIFMTVQQLLVAAIPTALVERMPSGDPDRFPALAILDGMQQPIETETGVTRYELTLTIEGFVEGHGGDEAHDALNDLYVDVVTCLMAEPPLQGLAETINEGGMRVSVAPLAAQRRLGFGVDFSIEFSTVRGNPAQLP